MVGDGFLACDITFEKNVGPSKHQAVGLHINANISTVYHCNMLENQDIIYVHSIYQFYTGCFIIRTIDFIFGKAVVVLQNCDICAHHPNPDQRNIVTAHGGDDPNENTGIVIQRCKIRATSNLQAVAGSFQSYLGRPWKRYSRTVVIQMEISNIIYLAGWFEWYGDFTNATLYYAEHWNTSPGANMSK